MSAIRDLKDELQTLAVNAGVAATQIARSLADEDVLVASGRWPVVGIVTGDATFIDGTEQGVRAIRRLPVELHILDETETAATTLVERLLATMPEVVIDSGGRQIDVTIERELHSDHVAEVTAYYLCVVVLRFDIPTGGTDGT